MASGRGGWEVGGGGGGLLFFFFLPLLPRSGTSTSKPSLSGAASPSLRISSATLIDLHSMVTRKYTNPDLLNTCLVCFLPPGDELHQIPLPARRRGAERGWRVAAEQGAGDYGRHHHGSRGNGRLAFH